MSRKIAGNRKKKMLANPEQFAKEEQKQKLRVQFWKAYGAYEYFDRKGDFFNAVRIKEQIIKPIQKELEALR